MGAPLPQSIVNVPDAPIVKLNKEFAGMLFNVTRNSPIPDSPHSPAGLPMGSVTE
jgi:hypothetical protein